MIQIVSKDDLLVVSGHAGAAEKGQDIVCAAVSTLVTGAAEIWKDREDVEIDKWQGEEDARFIFLFRLDILKEDIRQEYMFLQKYLRLLFETYPEYISFSG